MNSVIEEVTLNLIRRSEKSRQAYLGKCARTREQLPPKKRLSCGNLAHGYAACSPQEKQRIADMRTGNIGIITSYNDMLSAHQPLADYPAELKSHALSLGGTAQVASGVPAMCDGVTQGQPGMELSLFSREVVALATAVGLSHNLFDSVICLGICDKIVPGMLLGALQFGHLPVAFIGSGPMATGISNKEKASVRQQYAQGKADRDQLLAVESASYHSAGTCTFYGTANGNQVLMETLGLQLPGSSFLPIDSPLRPALSYTLVKQLLSDKVKPVSEVITEASIVNAVVALLATGGSTNHTLHLVAIARAAGIDLTWQDMDTLSAAVPMLARIYPNGSADINDFQAAGGMAFLIGELASAGLLNKDVFNVLGEGLDRYSCQPSLNDCAEIDWLEPVLKSTRTDVLAPVDKPFATQGGLRALSGNLGQCVIKVSAVHESHWKIKAPCRIFCTQDAIKTAFDAGELNQDTVIVVRFQGPAANGMPELHKMTPYLGVLQDRGFSVALVTDGRMSGASGKVPAAIHLVPEAIKGGPIALLHDGDVIELNAKDGTLTAHVPAEQWQARKPADTPTIDDNLGRNLFELFRQNTSDAAQGASLFNDVTNT